MIRIYPIVEGHGEVESIRILLTRIWLELLQRTGIEILHPHRLPKSKITKPDELRRALELARRKLAASLTTADSDLVLVLFDADNDLPCIVAPYLSAALADVRPQIDFAIVLANIEYESWFAGAADSLTEYLQLDASALQAPERVGKGWIDHHMITGNYSETLDQPRLTSRMDLKLARTRCPSFDKLCRELEARNGV